MKIDKNYKVEIPVQDTEEVRELMETLKVVLPGFGVECSYLKVKTHPEETQQQMVWLRWLDKPQELPNE